MSSEVSASPLIDHLARDKALDISRSFIVEAPAGSGKTTLLTQRFLRLLAATESPESIIAITFSRKAAEEMRARIVGALAVANDENNTLDRVTAEWARAAAANAATREWALDTNPRRLRILTIDALAQLIVRRHPLLAGGVGGQQVTEDASNLYALAARNTIEEVGAGSEWSPAVRHILTHVDNNWPRLERLLSMMLANRDQWLVPVASKPRREAIEQTLRLIVERKLRQLKPLFDSHAEKQLLEIAQFCGVNVSSLNGNSNIAAMAAMESFPNADADDLPYWRGLCELFLTNRERTPRKRLTKNEGFPAKDPEAARLKATLSDLINGSDARLIAGLQEVADLPDTALTYASWQKLEALFTVLKLAAAHLGLVFQQTGDVDFTEITLSAINTLGSDEVPSEASLLLDYQIEHLLVDEFQDTSVAQHQLIERLIAGWSADQHRSLFLVGDPMQSIYRFRQADVTRFTKTFAEQRFAQVPLEALSLQANFRSDPNVVEWINQALSRMAAADSKFPDTVQLSAVKPSQTAARVEVHGLSKNASSGAHIVDLVKHIRHQKISGERPPSIAILVRNRSHLSDITSRLREANIPVLATDIDSLLEQPVISDLSALARALLHPADSTAWFALLRAPWLGLSLTELSHVAMSAQGELIPAILHAAQNLTRLSENSRKRLTAFNAVVLPATQLVGRMAIAEIVSDTWYGLRGAEMARADKTYHYAERFLKLLDDFEQREGLVTAPALEQFLARRFVSPVADSGEPVQVMTIHKAKGLEFDAVILPGLNRGTRSDDNPLLRWQSSADDDVLMSLLPARGAEDQIYNYLRGEDKQAADEECYRLLYVALTRAKIQLHLVCETIDEDSKPYKGSLQQLLWPAVAEQVVEREPHANADEQDEHSDVVRRQRLLRRLKTLPLAERNPRKTLEAPTPITKLEFSWAGSAAKYIGTVTHGILHLMGQLGLGQFKQVWDVSADKLIERRLVTVGIEAGQLGAARATVAEAIGTVLNSERGRWLFDTRHHDAHSELPLTALVDGHSVNVILDRTFVSNDGVRWIVDFKTSEHREADLDSFLDIQTERYSPQLNHYAEVFNAIEARPTKLALYFPLHDAWREWEYEASEAC
ncbi:MAG: UvrD-helicase domain-containing protein [Gammaproteobacteria bacterium]